MISKSTYDTSIRYAHDGYSFEAPETKYLLRIIKLERKHRDILDVVEDKLMEIRDTDTEYITFDCPKKDYSEIRSVLKHYRYAFWENDIEKKDKDAITYEVKLCAR